MMKKECRVVIYKEGLLGSLFFGEAKADPDKMSQFLSSYTREGWEVKTMSVERRRTALFAAAAAPTGGAETLRRTCARVDARPRVCPPKPRGFL